MVRCIEERRPEYGKPISPPVLSHRREAPLPSDFPFRRDLCKCANAKSPRPGLRFRKFYSAGITAPADTSNFTFHHVNPFKASEAVLKKFFQSKKFTPLHNHI